METYEQEYTVTVIKLAQRTLDEKAIVGHQALIIAGVNSKSLKIRGWQVSAYYPEGNHTGWAQCFASDDEDAKYRYEYYLKVRYEGRTTPAANDHQGILSSIYRKAKTPAYGSWTLAVVNGEPYVPIAEGEDAFSDDLVGYAEVKIPDAWQDAFAHLYGLDAHRDMIMDAVEAAIDSDYANRFHVALVGPPGCGKSDLAGTYKKLFGADAVLEFDATAMTSAGVIKTLTEIEILPRFMVIEEIEKAPSDALSFLLSVCDQRGEVRKTTYRQSVQRDTKVVVIATVNDYDLFCKMASGALASRFANTLWFERPSRDLLNMILTREVQKVNGNLAWIEPTLDYCEEHNIDDPRKAQALCLCGRDKWLATDSNGKSQYAKLLAATARRTQSLDDVTEG